MYAKCIRLRQKRRGVGVDGRVMLNGPSNTKLQESCNLDGNRFRVPVSSGAPVKTIRKFRTPYQAGISLRSKINMIYQKRDNNNTK